MLKTISITNFQKHRKAIIELDLVTVIVGRSDAGKSSIFRALRWVVTNRPRGDAIITHGEKQTAVELEFDNHVVKKTRQSTQEYFLDGEPLKAFGASVPEPVELACNIDPVSFQGQHDPIFWFSDSPASVSQSINDLMGLDEMDRVQSDIDSDARKIKTLRDHLENEKETNDTTLRTLSSISVCRNELTVLLRESASVRAREESLTALEVVLSDIPPDDDDYKGFLMDARDLHALEQTISRLSTQVSSISAQLRDLVRIQEDQKRATDRHTEAVKQLTEILKDRCPLCEQETR